MKSCYYGLKSQIFITAGQRPADAAINTLCLKGRTNLLKISDFLSPAFQAAAVCRGSAYCASLVCGYENQAFQAKNSVTTYYIFEREMVLDN